MCDICRQWPCDSRCPNAPEPAAVYTCSYCGEPIQVGEECVSIEENHYHEDCFSDAAVGILFKEFGASKGVAEVDGW